MKFQMLIIGGGVSGLRIGSLLSKADISFKILESRDRLGGRVLTDIKDNNYFDLGPTWYWPESENTIVNLIDELNISTVEQYNSGSSLLEFSKDNAPKRVASSEVNSESMRIIGGVNTLVDALKNDVTPDSIETGKKVTSVRHEDDHSISVNTYDETDGTEETYHADVIILTVPPAVRSSHSNEVIKDEVIKQLTRLFGSEAKYYKNIHYKDWSKDKHTVTEGDKLNIESFPTYGPPPSYRDNILFAGTEYDKNHGGHLEGALATAEKAYNDVKRIFNLT